MHYIFDSGRFFCDFPASLQSIYCRAWEALMKRRYDVCTTASHSGLFGQISGAHGEAQTHCTRQAIPAGVQGTRNHAGTCDGAELLVMWWGRGTLNQPQLMHCLFDLLLLRTGWKRIDQLVEPFTMSRMCFFDARRANQALSVRRWTRLHFAIIQMNSTV